MFKKPGSHGPKTKTNGLVGDVGCKQRFGLQAPPCLSFIQVRIPNSDTFCWEEIYSNSSYTDHSNYKSVVLMERFGLMTSIRCVQPKFPPKALS